MARRVSTTAAAVGKPQLATIDVRLRGVDYRMVELSAQQYDQLLAQATSEVDGPLGKTEQTDEALLLRLMTIKCITEPKMTADAYADLGLRVTRKLQTLVNGLHFGDEPEEPEDEKDDDEGEATEPTPIRAGD
jgi:hypothetical protein